MKKIVISGECITRVAGERIKEFFPKTIIIHAYGLTEASPRVSFLPPDMFADYFESVGYPLDLVQVKICDKNGQIVKSGEVGLLWVKGPSVMIGYYNNERLTRKTIQNGWLNTGDMALQDKTGAIFIKGRADNMIIRGGQNIYPEEIDNKIMDLEEFDDAAAYGVDSVSTQQIVAEVVLNSRFSTMTAVDVMKRLGSKLPQYLLPNTVVIVDSIKKSISGKKLRRNQAEGKK